MVREHAVHYPLHLLRVPETRDPYLSVCQSIYYADLGLMFDTNWPGYALIQTPLSPDTSVLERLQHKKQ